VVPPIVEGAHKANRIRDYCVANDLRLDQSFAYSDSASDYPMLAVVGRPTAVNPDIRLRSLARSYEWPILDLR
jgi:phosphoserine phosphatase